MLSSSSCVTMVTVPSATCCVCLPRCQTKKANTQPQRSRLAGCTGWFHEARRTWLLDSWQSKVTGRQTDPGAGYSLSQWGDTSAGVLPYLFNLKFNNRIIVHNNCHNGMFLCFSVCLTVIMLLILLGPGMMPSMMSSGGRQDPPGHSGFGSDYLSGESRGTVCDIFSPPCWCSQALQCPLSARHLGCSAPWRSITK